MTEVTGSTGPDTGAQASATAPPVATGAPASQVEAGEQPRAQAAETRRRILEVALEAFTEQGYDKTSMRELAKRLGFTTAALYYHFDSKDEILSALAVDYFSCPSPVDRLAEERHVGLSAWACSVDELIEHLLGQRRLFRMVERNQAALEQLARTKTTVERHRQREELFHRIVGDRSLPAADRVRIACSLGAIIGLVMHCGGAFDDLDDEQFRHEVSLAVHAMLGDQASATS